MASRVGLLLLVNLPDLGGLHAVLQVRGTFNPETMGPESYPGGCQITCAGKVEQGESSQDALRREVQEELGVELSFIRWPPDFIIGSGDRSVAVVYRHESAILTSLRLHPGTGGLRLIRSDTLVVDLKKFSKVDGVRDRNVVAMFADEAMIVQEAFHMFGG